MTPRRWRDQALPRSLHQVLHSTTRDEADAESQRAALEQRLASLGVLPLASSIAEHAGSASPPGPTSAPLPSAAATVPHGLLALPAKLWVSALLIGALSGAAAYGALGRRSPPRATAKAASARPATALRGATAAGEVATAPFEPQPMRAALAKAASTPARSTARKPLAQDGSSLRAELKLMDAMRARVHDSPATALLHADAHEQDFPSGSLAPERELLRVEALLELHRLDDARRVAAQIERDSPGSAYARRAAALLQRALLAPD